MISKTTKFCGESIKGLKEQFHSIVLQTGEGICTCSKYSAYWMSWICGLSLNWNDNRESSKIWYLVLKIIIKRSSVDYWNDIVSLNKMWKIWCHLTNMMEGTINTFPKYKRNTINFIIKWMNIFSLHYICCYILCLCNQYYMWRNFSAGVGQNKILCLVHLLHTKISLNRASKPHDHAWKGHCHDSSSSVSKWVLVQYKHLYLCNIFHLCQILVFVHCECWML